MSPTAVGLPGPVGRVVRRLSTVEAAAAAGLVCAFGWAFGLRGLVSVPDIGATDHEIRAYYAHAANASASVAWLQVLVFATIAFLWFVGVIRGRLGDREPKLFGTVFFGASILLAGLIFVGAALLAAPSVLVEVGGKVPSAGAAAMTRAAALTVFSIFVPRIATLVMFSTASLGRVTGALPRWLVLLTYVVGITELVNVTISAPTFFIIPGWIALVSVVLLVRHPAESFDLSVLDPGPITDESGAPEPD